MGLKYSDMVRAGLVPCLQRKKSYGKNWGTDAEREFVREKILQNKDFIRLALEKSGATYINEILGNLVTFAIKCTDAYYNG